MIFGSVCSGIEAASAAWHPLGWRAAFVSEIEAFPSAVLAHHYPDVRNLGDMTKFQEWPDAAIDVLVGGTPCQSFSVAGLRKGLADPRGNLTLTFLAIAERYKPAWIVWENVPGVISDKTGAFAAFLDGLEALGYVIDCDILDAQFHGVPQRRRRVFVCGQSRESLLNAKTDSSALTIAQCWQEILHGIFAEVSKESGNAQVSSDSAFLSRDGVMRRMRLFSLHGGQCNYKSLRENLVAAFLRHQDAPENSDVLRGEKAKELTLADRLMGSPTESQFSLTAESLSRDLDASYEVMKSFITSTATKTITAAEIYTCSKAALTIAKLTLRLNQSSPCFWSAASSSLITLEAFTEYAGFTSSDLFGDVERIQAWRDFVGEAEYTNDALVSVGVGCFGKIFPLADCLQGNSTPCREARKTAPTIPSRSTAGGGLGTDFDCDGGLIQHTVGDGAFDVAHPLRAQAQTSHRADSDNYVAHSLRADGFDASEDGTGRGTPLVAVPHCDVMPIMMNGANTPAGHNARSGHSKDSYIVPVAFAENSRAELRLCGGDGQTAAQLTTGGGKPGQGQPCIAASSAVRRLTPRECERLQGFPDDWTLIQVRGKPAADGPRYKALGNSMAVPVMRFIGERIAMVAAIKANEVAA